MQAAEELGLSACHKAEEPLFEELVAHVSQGERGGRAKRGLQRHRRPVRSEPTRQIQLGPVRGQIVRDEVVVDVQAIALGAKKDHGATAEETRCGRPIRRDQNPQQQAGQ
jgi:hypothetical protein